MYFLNFWIIERFFFVYDIEFLIKILVFDFEIIQKRERVNNRPPVMLACQRLLWLAANDGGLILIVSMSHDLVGFVLFVRRFAISAFYRPNLSILAYFNCIACCLKICSWATSWNWPVWPFWRKKFLQNSYHTSL